MNLRNHLILLVLIFTGPHVSQSMEENPRKRKAEVARLDIPRELVETHRSLVSQFKDPRKKKAKEGRLDIPAELAETHRSLIFECPDRRSSFYLPTDLQSSLIEQSREQRRYQAYKQQFLELLPSLEGIQSSTDDPLVEAVLNDDYDFAQFLLDRGAKPTFRSKRRINAFDALSLKNSKLYGRPLAMKRFEALLIRYVAPGELTRSLEALEKPLSKEEAQNLYVVSFQELQNKKFSYEEYRKNLIQAIPFLDNPQDYYHNPLLEAVSEGDYDFAKFLLEHGASPTFSGMNRMSGYDALSLIDSKIYDNPDEVRRFKRLLDGYLKPGEHITPYSGGSGNYSPNPALNN